MRLDVGERQRAASKEPLLEGRAKTIEYFSKNVGTGPAKRHALGAVEGFWGLWIDGVGVKVI